MRRVRLRGSGAARAAGDTVVLGYHRVPLEPSGPLDVSPAVLRRQVAWLVSRGYQPATFTRAVLERDSTATVVATFDDGDETVPRNAAPALAEIGASGTLFVVTELVGTPGYAGWDELSGLARAGWEIGSHTRTHADLPRLDDARLDEELRGSREALEEALGVPCRSLAYPWGNADERVMRAAANAGYQAACVFGSGFRREHRFAWPRVGVYLGDGPVLFRMKTSRAVRSMRASPPGQRVEARMRRLRRLPAP